MDNMDDMRGQENFKVAKTKDIIKKYIHEVAMTESRQKDRTSSTQMASPSGSSSPKDRSNRREEETWVEGQNPGQGLADHIIRQVVSEHSDCGKSVARSDTRNHIRAMRSKSLGRQQTGNTSIAKRKSIS
jgi:hypothetical protein